MSKVSMKKIKIVFLTLIIVFGFSTLSNSNSAPTSFADLAYSHGEHEQHTLAV